MGESPRTILIADDAAMFRELGALFLARSGRVVTANNGFEALELARRYRPSVVVADLDMPCLGGDGLCIRLKQDPELREVPVILVLPGDLGEDRARAVRAGADDVISKPISRSALLQAVNHFLRGGTTRGHARVALEAPVRIRRSKEQHGGLARNLSRGGMFVETDLPAATGEELALEFELPDAPLRLLPTAEVIWRREPDAGLPSGMGLRFLALDGDSAREIDSYVYERAGSEALEASAGGAQ